MGVPGTVLDEGRARLQLQVSSAVATMRFVGNAMASPPAALTRSSCVDPENMAADHLAFNSSICLELQK